MPTTMKMSLGLFLLSFLVPDLVLGADNKETFLRIEKEQTN